MHSFYHVLFIHISYMLMLQIIGRLADGGSGSLMDDITRARQLLVSEAPVKEKSVLKTCLVKIGFVVTLFVAKKW